MATMKLKISGMSCSHCVRTITQALEQVEGVKSAHVDFPGGRATVEYVEGRTEARDLVGAVMDEGYVAEEIV
jgi:copper chaperone CopZ